MIRFMLARLVLGMISAALGDNEALWTSDDQRAYEEACTQR